jgi:hypothetical protein
VSRAPKFSAEIVDFPSHGEADAPLNADSLAIPIFWDAVTPCGRYRVCLRNGGIAMRRAILSTFVLLVSGCQSLSSGPGPDWPWRDRKEDDKTATTPADPCKADTCTRGEARAAYIKALSFCRSVHNYYERGGRVADGSRFYAGVAGSLAGALTAAASSNGAKVLGGLSGVTNAWQAGIDESIAFALAAKRQEAVGTAAIGASPTKDDWSDANLIVAKSMNMAFACSVAAGTSDVQGISRLLDDRPRPPDKAASGPGNAASAAGASTANVNKNSIKRP